jgi:hypothetical protein
MARGDSREGKWRGNWLMEWVASTLTLPRNMVYPALLPLMRTPRLPAVDWTDGPADLNGLVRFCERRNLVSAGVSSHFKRSLPRCDVLQCSPDCLTLGDVTYPLVTGYVTSKKSEDLRLDLLVDWPALCAYIPLPGSGYLSLVIRLDVRVAVGHFPAGQNKCLSSPMCPDLPGAYPATILLAILCSFPLVHCPEHKSDH